MRRAEREPGTTVLAPNNKRCKHTRQNCLDTRVRSIRGFDLQRALQAIPVEANLVPRRSDRSKRTDPLLRFALGDPVECLVDRWLSGTVVALNQRDEDGVHVPYQVKLSDQSGALLWVPSDSDCVIRCRRERPRFAAPPSDRRSRVEDAVAEEIEAWDPQRTLSAADFHYVLDATADRVIRVMKEDARTDLDSEDLAYIARGVRRMVQPGPGATEGMVVIDDQRKHGRDVQAEPVRFQPSDRVVCRLGRRSWASGVVRTHAVNDENARFLSCVQIMTDSPDSRIVDVPENCCHLQRAANPAAAGDAAPATSAATALRSPRPHRDGEPSRQL